MADNTAQSLRRVTFVATAIAVVLFLAISAVHQLMLVPMAGGLQSPDMHVFGYGAGTMTAWIEALGREGRIAFLTWHSFGFDLIFPPSFAFAGTLVGWAAGTRHGWFNRMVWLRRLVLVAIAPLFYLGFDWSENLNVARLVADPMTVNDQTVAAASFLTVWKWVFVALTLVLPAGLWMARKRAREET